jgi:hypothetical protein
MLGGFAGIKIHGFDERLGCERSAACGLVPEHQAAMGFSPKTEVNFLRWRSAAVPSLSDLGMEPS